MSSPPLSIVYRREDQIFYAVAPPPSTPLPTLTNLKLKLRRRIFTFLREDIQALCAAEKTCKALKEVVADDTLWSKSPVVVGRDPRLPTRRLQICTQRVLRNIRSIQKISDDHNLSVWEHHMNLQEFKEFMQDMQFFAENCGLQNAKIEYPCQPPRTYVHHVELRGDTAAVLAWLLQANIVRTLGKVNAYACAVTPKDQFPVVSASHWKNVLLLQSRGPPNEPFRAVDMVPHNPHLFPTNTKMDRMILTWSRMAGIVRMSSDMFDVVRGLVPLFYGAWMNQLCVQINGSRNEDGLFGRGDRPLSSGEHPRNVPPYPVMEFRNNEFHFSHVVVPGMLEAAAETAAAHIPTEINRVYGNLWYGERLWNDEKFHDKIMNGYTVLEDDGGDGMDNDDDSDNDDVSGDNGYVFTMEVFPVPYEIYFEFIQVDGNINGWLV